MFIVGNTCTVEVTFDSPLSFQNAINSSCYGIREDIGVPVTIQNVELNYTVLQTGLGAIVFSGNGNYSNRFLITGGLETPIQVGDYISLGSTWNTVNFAKVIGIVGPVPPPLLNQLPPSTIFELDRELLLADPENGSIPWEHTQGLEGVTLTTSKHTNECWYELSVRNLYTTTETSYEETQSYFAVSSKPQLVSVVAGDDGQLLATFSDVMRVDSVLLDPTEYTVAWPRLGRPPAGVVIRSVTAISPTQVMLTTTGLADNDYQLTVSSSSPHDIAGNPIDPIFNQAVFTAGIPLAARSVFTDHGPITKPEEILQTGATASIDDATQLTLPTATIAPSHVGLYIRLTGTLINAGEFKITSRVSATIVKVVASFTAPDPASGAIVWELFDPRDGEIADDPTDVVVRINGGPVVPDAVIGLLGQIVLPSVPAPTDDVRVDYCWISNPVVDLRRLNSKEFKLNDWNRNTNDPIDVNQHKYRYNNTLIKPETYIPLDLRAQLDQPLQRDLKYRAFERAYSTALNDPNLLLLNSPTHRIAFPNLSRTVSSVFVNYQANVLPEDATPSWVRAGSGTATVVGPNLIVVDSSSGTFPSGNPIFWTQDIDLTFQHVFAIAWRMLINTYTVTEGVFTGVAAGYSDSEKAIVVGFLNDGGTKKIGLLKAGAGNDPSIIDAWTGGIDSLGNPTGAPATLDWGILRSYRIFRDRSGIITVYVDGSIAATLRVLPDELPYLEELNAPFNELQGAFFGSLSRLAENTSTWSFVRYTVIPLNLYQTAPSIFVSFEGTTPPEDASQAWTPVGFHGTETIISSDYLLLDSTSATDLPSESIAGLISGDFKGFFRIEPLLAESFDTVLDVNVALRTSTHGITPNAILAAIDDGSYLIQLSFFSETAVPKFSYGGRALPENFSPYFWTKNGTASSSMVGQYLLIDDTSTIDGAVYSLDDLSIDGSPNRIVGSLNDYVIEFRAQVLSYTVDVGNFAGVTISVDDSLRAVGILFEEITGQRYVSLHSDGSVLDRFLFDWFDGYFHTYRVYKSTVGDLVSLFIDGIFIGSVAYSSFLPIPPSLTGMVSFGSATPISNLSKSSVLWAYANFWRVNSGVKTFAGIWKGHDSNSLIGYHLPLRVSGNATINGNVLTDVNANFTIAGVLSGDRLVIDDGINKGVYSVLAVISTTRLTVDPPGFPFQPSEVSYRIVVEADLANQHKYRIIKDSEGNVSVILDAGTEPWIHANYSSIDLPPSSSGIARTIAGGLPSILWGAFDPTNLSQTSWDYVRFGAVRSQSELGIVPHHQILNQRNVMASYEHHRTILPHTHTDFWSESEGIPPQNEPDFLRDPNLIAYTLLNESTPLVPSTQTYEVRSPTPVLIYVSALNKPEDVLNNQGFLLNEATQKIEIIVPDDVLYNSLEVIETSSGSPDLITPFCDGAPDFGTFFWNDTTCLTYTGDVLPEDDTSAPTPWSKASDDPTHQFASVAGGILTYGTDSTGTRTVYKNTTPLPDSRSLETEVLFRLKVLQDTSGGLADSQIRVGFSSPGVTLGLAFITTPIGERYVLVVDLNNGRTVGGIPFDFYDNSYHNYRLVRNPGEAAIQIFIDL